MSPIRCEIVTQERVVFDKAVDMVIAPGVDGELGILPHHVPLLTALAWAPSLGVRQNTNHLTHLTPPFSGTVTSFTTAATGLDFPKAQIQS